MSDCLEKENALKWCMALNQIKPTRCEILLRDLSTCYSKMLN